MILQIRGMSKLMCFTELKITKLVAHMKDRISFKTGMIRNEFYYHSLKYDFENDRLTNK